MQIRFAPRVAAVLLVASTFTTPAFAVNKDMVQLQTQIQQLQEAIARLQQSNDERMGVLKDLVQQNADTVNRMSVNMDALQKQLAAQQGASGTKVDQVSGQVQALNDSLDEIRARMGRLEKMVADVQSQTQTIGAAVQNLPSTTTPGVAVPEASRAPVTTPAPAPAPASAAVEPIRNARPTKPSAGIPETALSAPLPARRGAIASAPAADLYKSAYGDYMSAKYGLATSEFGDIIRSYPDDTLSGNAYYYLGEMEYRQAKYAAAAKDYDHVLEQFPDNNKIPAAHLHKGQALIELKQTDAGIRELRALIQRFPASPEALQARSKLNTLGVPVRPKP